MLRVWSLLALLLIGVACSPTAKVNVSSPGGVPVIGQPSPVTVTGAGAHQRLTITVTSTDSIGVRWRSTSTATTDQHGRLTLNAADLIAEMTPLGPDQAGAYVWGSGAQAFRVQVGSATTTVFRRFADHAIRRTPVGAHGLVGSFYSSGLPERHSAVLFIGGSEGGEPSPLIPAVLAGNGHPVLALAYFKEPGLPQTLSRVPLEYFATALRWLAHQPGVDPNRLIVDGDSRGGEAALLIGATYPDLVHGVIAGVPSNVAVCSYPGCTGPAWTLHGKPVPYTRQFDDPYPTDNPQAIIKVERINGPVLLDCGGRDTVWDSCPYTIAVMARLAHARFRFPHQLLQCADCDHYVGRGVPTEPYVPSIYSPTENDIRTYSRLFAATLALLGS